MTSDFLAAACPWKRLKSSEIVTFNISGGIVFKLSVARNVVAMRDGFQDLARPIAEGGDGGAELEALDEAAEVGLGELEDDAGHVLGRAQHPHYVGV